MQVYNYEFKGHIFKAGTIGIKIKLICKLDINLKKHYYFMYEQNNNFISMFKIS